MAGITMNVFRQDAFSGLTLTEMVNKFPYNPDFLGSFGPSLFEPFPILTTAVQVDQKQGILTLIGSSPRGAPAQQRYNEKRQARYFDCTRLSVEETIYANELQNVRSEKNEVEALKDLQEEVYIRLLGPTGLTSMMEYTWENHRLGAIQGIVYDSDGATVIQNWFTQFGIAPAAEIGFNLAANVTGTLIPLCHEIRRAMQRKGQGAFLRGRTQVHSVVGDEFWDAFTQHPDVVRTYENWCAVANGTTVIRDGAPQLRVARDFEEKFYFGGIYWTNYRGSDDTTTVAIPTDKAKFFPVGAPGVFKQVMAPGEGMEEVNTKGRPSYVYRDIDPSEEKTWVKFKHKSFPLYMCTRPEMLQFGRYEA